MAHTNFPEEVRFATNSSQLSKFVIEVIERLYNINVIKVHPMLLEAGLIFIEGLDKHKLVRGFIKYTYKHWEIIHRRERRYFEENAHEIFKELQVDVNAFKLIFSTYDENGELYVTTEEEQIFWTFFHTLIKICIKYCNKHRGNLDIHDPDDNDKPEEERRRIVIDTTAMARLYEIKL